MKKTILTLLAAVALAFVGCKKEEVTIQTPSIVNDNYKMIVSIQDNNSGLQGATSSEATFGTFIVSTDGGDTTIFREIHDSCSTSSTGYYKEYIFDLRNDYNWELFYSVFSSYDCVELDMSDVISIQVFKNQLIIHDTIINGNISNRINI